MPAPKPKNTVTQRGKLKKDAHNRRTPHFGDSGIISNLGSTVDFFSKGGPPNKHHTRRKRNPKKAMEEHEPLLKTRNFLGMRHPLGSSKLQYANKKEKMVHPPK